MDLRTFEQQQIWTNLQQLLDQLALLQNSDRPLTADLQVDMEARAAYLQATYRARKRVAEIFTDQMMSETTSHVANSLSSLNAAGQYTDVNRVNYANQALTYLLAAVTTAVRDWPSPIPTRKEVEEGESIVGALVDAQRAGIKSLQSRLSSAIDDLDALREDIPSVVRAKDDAITAINSAVERAISAVDAQKGRVDTALDSVRSAVAQVPDDTESMFDTWVEAQSEAIAQKVDPVAKRVNDVEKRAKGKLDAISTVERKYRTLVDLDTAERLAGHYDSESKALRHAAIIAYWIGGGALIVAAMPIGVSIILGLAFPVEVADYDWGGLTARALFAVLLGGVATVAVRVASRLLQQASSSKRFAMEMRTFEPFLSGVSKDEAVDAARLELVAKSFGMSYALPAASTTNDDEVVNVTALDKVLSVVTKFLAR